MMDFLSTVDMEALRAWFSAEVLPHLTSVVMILGVALVELIPAVRSLVKAKNAFSKVAADVDAYNRSKIEYDLRIEERERAFEGRMEELHRQYTEQVRELCKTVQTYEEKLAESEARLSRVLHHVEVSTDKTERMVYLGMSNSCELVANGAARKIAQVEEEHDNDGEEVESDAEEESEGEG